MTFIKLLTACLALISTARIDAATLVWSGSQDNGLALEGGTAMLPTGSLVRIGVFSISDSQIESLLYAGNFAAVDAAFTVLGATAIGQGFGDNSGYFQTTSTTPRPITSQPGDLNIAGQQLYIWAMDASSTAGITLNTQHGIFYLSKAVDSDWAVPADAQLDGQVTLDLSDLTATDPSQLSASANLVVGSFSQTPVQSSVRKQANFTLETVPEPTSAGLAVIGGIAMLLRRRRRA